MSTEDTSMDQEQGTLSYRGSSRLSRLPRASASTIPDIHQDDTTRGTSIPRSSVTGSMRMKTAEPLSENSNTTIKSRFGFGVQSLRNRNKSPSKVPDQPSQASAIETTLPYVGEAIPHHGDGDENAMAYDSIKVDQSMDVVDAHKRRIRPSLSERTIETMSHVPSSPSPSRYRSSTASSTGSLGYPLQVTSPSRDSDPSKAYRGRATSPPKPISRHAQRCGSPTKDIPPVPFFDRIYTPPKALVKDQGSRIAKLSRSSQRIAPSAVDDGYLTQFQQPRQIPHGHKVKSMYNLRGAAAKSSVSKPAIASIFKDPPKPSAICKKLQLAGMDSNSGLLKPRLPGENVLAVSPKLAMKQVSQTTVMVEGAIRMEGKAGLESSHKSSSALKETIARAKAAKRLAATKLQTDAESDAQQPVQQELNDFTTGQLSVGALKRRIQGAATTGILNVTAQGLKDMPKEIMNMYDYDENSKMTWSETVDLTKLVMANNELAEFSDDTFPDWTMDELVEDDDKNNIFGALEVLDLHGNQLTQLPIGLRRLERLHTLNLSNNKFTNDVLGVIRQIPNLKYLNLAGNDIKGVLPANISELQHLCVLDLHSNKISEVPSSIVDLQDLQKLDISGNKLSHFPMSKSSSLLELDLSNNKLSGTLLSPGCLQNLHHLNIAMNQIDQLCDGDLQMSQLRTLILDNNQIKTLPDMSGLSELATLSVSQNQVESIPQCFIWLQALRNANVSGNNIKTIEVDISKMEKLVSINLAGNPLRERKYLTMNTEDIKVDLAKRMGTSDKSKETSDSGPSDDPSTLSDSASSEKSPYLYTPVNGVLNLSSLSLTSIDTNLVDLTKNIHTIRLSNNDLTSFPTNLLSHPNIKYSLKSLDISHNPSLHPKTYLTESISLPLLQSLYIVSTGLESLDTLTTHISAPALQELNISCHKLTGHLPWVRAWFPSLTTLLATDNWFTSVDTEAVRGLEVLDIRNNEIESLPPKIGEFGNVSEGKYEAGRLRSFDCTGNKFRIPRLAVLERGTEATLRDLRRMVPLEAVGEEWR